MKPLFIPLKAEYFDAFRDGTKDAEYRVYGARWNERTCTPGRPVLLSRGYGKRARLTGTIRSFAQYPVSGLNQAAADAFARCYGPLDVMVAAIQITVDKEQS